MQFDFGKTRLSLTFPFAAVLTLMLLLCEEEIVLISLFSSLFHEGGHLFFMMLFSVKPSLISLGAFGIRIERGEGKLLSYKKEALIALGGVLGNFVLALCGVCFYLFFHSLWGLKLFAVNVFIACFNLIPIRQLDAGRCLECLLMHSFDDKMCEKIIRTVSLITVFALSLSCVLYNIFFGLNVSLIAVTLYLIIISTFKEFYNDK